MKEILVNGVRITDPKDLEDINRTLLKEAEGRMKLKIASAVEAILRESGVALKRGRQIVITSDTGMEGLLGGLKVETPSKAPKPTQITDKPTQITDLEGQVRNFPSNHKAFIWINSKYGDRNMKRLSDLEKDDILVKMEPVDGDQDIYKMKIPGEEVA